MSYDYEDELEPTRVRKSRKKPSMQNSSVQKPSDMEEKVDFSNADMDDIDSDYAEKSSSFTTLGRLDIDDTGAEFRPHGSTRSRRMANESAASKSDRTGRDTVRADRARTSSNGTNGSGGKPPKNKKRRRMIIMIIAEIFALFFIFAYAYVYKIISLPQRTVFSKEDIKNQELTVDDLKKMKGYWMIAVFGVDDRGDNVEKGTNADVIMVCCINQDTGDIKLVSVYRDTYLNISDKNSYNKINASYASGGPEQALKALNKNLDLNITEYITFNWKAVADAINILGGIDLEISPAEFKYINGFITETVKYTGIGSHHLKKSGMNHLDGVQAVAYGRLRLMDTDFARTERQRKIIDLAFQKAKTASYSVLNNILVVILPQVSTNLDFVDLTNMALNITKYKLGETTGFPMARGDANINGAACVVPATLESNVIMLHKFLFADEVYTPTDSVKKISAKIASITGIYKEGQVSGPVGTKGSLPKETKAPVTTEEATTQESTEEQESTKESESKPPTTTPARPGIGETDADGNLVDAPEDPDIGHGPGTEATKPTKPVVKPSAPSTETPQPGPGTDIGTEPTSPIRPGDTVESPGNSPGTTPEQTVPSVPSPGDTTDSPGGPGDILDSNGPGN